MDIGLLIFSNKPAGAFGAPFAGHGDMSYSNFILWCGKKCKEKRAQAEADKQNMMLAAVNQAQQEAAAAEKQEQDRIAAEKEAERKKGEELLKKQNSEAAKIEAYKRVEKPQKEKELKVFAIAGGIALVFILAALAFKTSE